MKRIACALLLAAGLTAALGCTGAAKTSSSLYDAGRAAARLQGSSDAHLTANAANRPVSARPAPLAAPVKVDELPEPPRPPAAIAFFAWGDEVDLDAATIARLWGEVQAQGPVARSESSEPAAPAAGASVITAGLWFKVAGGLALIAAAVLLWAALPKIAAGAGVAGAVSIGVGIFLDKAEQVPWGWYAAGACAFLALVAVILWRKYRQWFVDLAAAVKFTGSDEVARANADLMPERQKLEQKAVLQANGVLLPTDKEA
jgi:hypothetical protein